VSPSPSLQCGKTDSRTTQSNCRSPPETSTSTRTHSISSEGGEGVDTGNTPPSRISSEGGGGGGVSTTPLPRVSSERGEWRVSTQVTLLHLTFRVREGVEGGVLTENPFVDEATTCLALKIADLSEDRHASTPRLLVTVQVQLSSHTRATYLLQCNSQQQSEMSHSLPHHYRTISQCRTVYAAAIAQSHNTTRSTRLLSLDTAIFTSYHDYYALWYYCYSTKGLLCPTTAPGCRESIELLPRHRKAHRSLNCEGTSPFGLSL
jgi:hypothetical protein